MRSPTEERGGEEYAVFFGRTPGSGINNNLLFSGHVFDFMHAPSKIAQQLHCASRKGIPYVWVPPFADGGVIHFYIQPRSCSNFAVWAASSRCSTRGKKTSTWVGYALETSQCQLGERFYQMSFFPFMTMFMTFS
jgi:hypothetical protein